jgi:hypothetical protein
MFIEGTERYLRESFRVLCPGGRLCATYLLLNDHSRAGIENGKSYRDPKFPVGNSFTYREDNPEEGIAHPEEQVIGLYESIGFEMTDIFYGNWSEGTENLQQDVIIAKKN